MTPEVGHSKLAKSIGLCRNFLSLVQQPDVAEHNEIKALYRLCDELSLSAHSLEIPSGEFDSKPAACHTSVSALDIIQQRFADLVAEPSIDGGDPWLDLWEIVDDLKRIVGLFDAKQKDAAQFEFKYGFQTHWGLHLASLRYYLHRSLRFEDT